MAYQVIARKWRPQRFADVVGQGHITKTLTNAIMQGRTAHAYLFVGPRGIGKTSSARIFAKALNCHSPVNGEPCCQCPSCTAIASNNSIDIIEIDAASNNSVQSMRELCDEVMYAPVNSQYKIYIIDEVHMLTAASWNALLKTVEEPPEHVKFIFATTEVHKVLATILSRCQRFDLRRIPSQLICDRLRLICDTENVPISDGALAAIARAADGGMRDAQSLLDQMVSFFSASDSNEISEDQVLSLFGLTESLEMEKLVHSMVVNDRAGLVTCIYELAYKGKDLEKLFEELLSFLRGIQLCHILPDPGAVLETGAESVEQLRRLAGVCSQDVVQRLLETLSPVGYTLHNALNKQVFLETIILKAMRLSHALQVDDLVRRLNQIRKNGELDVLDVVDMSQALPAQIPATVQTTVNDMKSPVAADVSVVQEPVVQAQTTGVQPVPTPSTQAPVEESHSAPVDDNDPPPWNTDETAQITNEPVVQEQIVKEEIIVSPETAVEQPVTQPVVQQQVAQPVVQQQVTQPVVQQQVTQPVAQQPATQPTKSAVLQPGGLAATIPSADDVPVRDASQDDVNAFESAPSSGEVDFMSDSPAVAAPVAVTEVVSGPAINASVPQSQEYVAPSEVVASENEAENQIYYSDAEMQEAENSADGISFVDFDSISTLNGEGGEFHYDEVAHLKKLKDEAAANPLVKDAVELFEGEIVDVHSSRGEEKN